MGKCGVRRAAAIFEAKCFACYLADHSPSMLDSCAPTKKKLDEVAGFVRTARSFALLVVGNCQLLHFVTHFLLPRHQHRTPFLPSFAAAATHYAATAAAAEAATHYQRATQTSLYAVNRRN